MSSLHVKGEKVSRKGGCQGWRCFPQRKKPRTLRYGVSLIDAWQFPTLAWGDPTLPSALRRFTSEFGMGSGGTTALQPPGKFCLSTRLLTCRLICYQAENLSLHAKTASAL